MTTPVRILAILGFAIAVSMTARADEVHVAVAANFTAPMKQIAAQFEQDTGHTLIASYGSTGKLYAQVKNGAPFEVFLAADSKTPTKLVSEGLAEATSQFTYAKGKLVLWSATSGFVDDKGEVLKKGVFEHIAIANPTLAPYGTAAVDAMKALGLYDAIAPKLVTGENIGQAFQYVRSGNAQLGFIALSQVMSNGKIDEGSAWVLPANLYAPINQDAVLLNTGKGKVAPDALMKYLTQSKSRAVIKSFGYEM